MKQCSFVGCFNDHKAYGLCGGHLAQQKSSKELTPLRSRRKKVISCESVGCDKTPYSKSLCRSHYNLKRRLEVAASKPPKIKQGDLTCLECPNKAYCQNLCTNHYLNYRRKLNFGNSVSPEHHAYKEIPGYVAAHARVKKLKGVASKYDCVECGITARDWSLSMFASKTYTEDSGKYENVRYSLEVEDYAPRCGPCHSAYDATAKRYIKYGELAL